MPLAGPSSSTSASSTPYPVSAASPANPAPASPAPARVPSGGATMLPGPSGSTAALMAVTVWQAMLTICIWIAAPWIPLRAHGCVVDRSLVSRVGTLLFVGTPLIAAKLLVGWMLGLF
jgi:hypothetical protein